MKKSENNPSIQCSKCGKWKRLHGTRDGKPLQRFFPACIQDGVEIIHKGEICNECCEEFCQPIGAS